MPQTAPEVFAFQTQGTMSYATDYTLIAETSKKMLLNNEERTAYSISISGMDVAFDDDVKNKVWGLNGREDIYELNIYAERLIVRSALTFPQTRTMILSLPPSIRHPQPSTPCPSARVRSMVQVLAISPFTLGISREICPKG